MTNAHYYSEIEKYLIHQPFPSMNKNFTKWANLDEDGIVIYDENVITKYSPTKGVQKQVQIFSKYF